MRSRVDDWAVHIVREHNTEADALVEKGVCGANKKNGRTTLKVLWSEGHWTVWVLGMGVVVTEYAVQVC